MECETEVVERARQGDRDAFGVLAEACRPMLHGLCFRLVHDGSMGEDLVQETLFQAYRDLGQLREADRFRAWLSGIAVNVCRTYLRRLKTRPAETGSVETAIPWSPGGVEGACCVDEALARLGSETRLTLKLFYGDGLSHAELGEMLGLSAAAIKSRLHRARERLRKESLAMMSDQARDRLGITEEAPWALRTILLVEPDDHVRESLQAALAAAGYEVVVLATGEAALQAAAAHRGQLVILDKRCGKPHWVEVLTLLQADQWCRENVPVAVVVDPGTKRDLTLAWQAGAVLCFTRPPQPDEVVSFVRRLERLWPDELKPQTAPHP